MYSLLAPCAVVSGRSEAEGRSRGLCHTLLLLAAPCFMPDIPFPDPPAEGNQAGRRSSHHYRITCLDAICLNIFISNASFSVVSSSALKNCLTLTFDQQGDISDVPRFCLFYISFGLELIALVLSALADIPPDAKEKVKRVHSQCSLIS